MGVGFDLKPCSKDDVPQGRTDSEACQLWTVVMLAVVSLQLLEPLGLHSSDI